MKRPFVYLCAPFSLGIAAGRLFAIPIFFSISATIAFILLAFLFLRNKRFSHTALYLGLFFLGASSIAAADILPADHISKIISEEPGKVYLKGAVLDDPIVTEAFHGARRSTFLLSAHSVRESSAWRKASGLVRASAYGSSPSAGPAGFGCGDEVVFEGMLSKIDSLRNPGLFNYSKYLELKNIRASLAVKEGSLIEVVAPAQGVSLRSAAYRVRRGIRDLLDGYFAQRFSGFLKAILIGDRGGMGESLNDDFLKTGTVHALAISGLNVGLMAGVFLFSFGALRERV